MGGSTDFWVGSFYNDRKERYPIFLNADRVHAFVITAGDTAPNLVTSELCFFRNVPFRLPPSICGKGCIPFPNDTAAIGFRYVPMHLGRVRNGERRVDHIAHQSFHLHGLTRPVQIAVRDDLRVRFSSRTTVVAPGWIRCAFDKLQRRTGRSVRDEQMCVLNFGIKRSGKN